MKKDIFIDNNVTKNFTNPMDPEYKKLVSWLMRNHEEKSQNAYLVVSNKLLSEYYSSNRHANRGTNIVVIIGTLQKEGRLIKISNSALKEFKRIHFTKKVQRRLTCNRSDRDYIPVVLLSERKYALTIDDNFRHDLVNFPGFRAVAEKRPELIPYAS